eukprot:NODE_664_length_4906_cov_0.509049.p3 type:complete len:161 gc:universal NODE_664_length_4906_cov_0.509049:3277-2795(-)
MAELLHMPTTSPVEFDLLKANCCEFRYFTCSGNHVVGVCLAEMSLYGTLDVSLLPATVTLFEISGNHVNKVIGQFQTTKMFTLEPNKLLNIDSSQISFITRIHQILTSKTLHFHPNPFLTTFGTFLLMQTTRMTIQIPSFPLPTNQQLLLLKRIQSNGVL